MRHSTITMLHPSCSVAYKHSSPFIHSYNIGPSVQTASFSTKTSPPEEGVVKWFDPIKKIWKILKEATQVRLFENQIVVDVRTTRNRLRSDPKFSILCDRGKLEKREADGSLIPQIISLPDLPGVSPPKGFEDQSSWDSFLLSEERFKLYKEVDDFIAGKTTLKGVAGFVPSAPHGMGKSGIGLLLACYAFLNRHILIYIPKCNDWLDKDEPTMAITFMENFRNLNADIAASIPAYRSKKTLLDLVLSTTDATALRDMTELLITLKTQEKHAVLYIFDEHNELYKEPAGGNSFLHDHPGFLNRFTRWTGPTGGKRTVTIYIGSAHSKFEFNLPGGESWRLKFLQPMTRKETELLISSPNSQLSLPDEFFKENGKVDQVKMEKLEWYTGYLPREIRILKEVGNFQKFEEQRTNEFKSRANALYEKCSDLQQQEYNEFLRRVLVPRYGGHVGNMANIGNFYDKGLFYKSPLGFECISGPAKNALTPLLSAVLRQYLPPINSVEDPGMRGVIHEQWNIYCFLSGDTISFSPFHVGTNHQSTPTPFTFKIDEVMYFDGDEKIQSNLENRRRLYVPTDKSHPAWDCIYDDGVTTAFFSFSISHFWDGNPSHDASVKKSFEGGKESQNSQIMNKLRGQDGFEVAIDEGNNLVQKDPSSNSLQNIYYFYGCGKKQVDIQTEAGTKRKSPTYGFIKFFGQEQMEKFGVKF